MEREVKMEKGGWRNKTEVRFGLWVENSNTLFDKEECRMKGGRDSLQSRKSA